MVEMQRARAEDEAKRQLIAAQFKEDQEMRCSHGDTDNKIKLIALFQVFVLNPFFALLRATGDSADRDRQKLLLLPLLLPLLLHQCPQPLRPLQLVRCAIVIDCIVC